MGRLGQKLIDFQMKVSFVEAAALTVGRSTGLFVEELIVSIAGESIVLMFEVSIVFVAEESIVSVLEMTLQLVIGSLEG